MRIILQRVSSASVRIDGIQVSDIGVGLLILVGIEASDDFEDIEWLCRKLISMRIFSDKEGMMNLSIREVRGSFLVVSQFTLFGSTKKGNRPSFIRSARPEQAEPLYNQFVHQLSLESGLLVRTGQFGADMKIELINDGPVTLFLDSRARE